MHMLALNRNGPEAELVEAAKILLSHGAQLSPLDEKGRTPLMLACANDRPRLAQYLIQEGAYVDQRCYLERRPVHYAASAGSLECLKTLREAHASLEMQDLQGASCLHFALSAERKREQLEPLLDFLLEAIGEAALLSPDRHGTTPLHLAAARAPLPVLQKLLTKHPNIYPKDRKGRGLIHYAAMTDRVDRLRILLDPTTKTPQQNSHTPLHSSARGCAPWATALLCGLPEASSWLDAQEPRHLRTPLHKAAAAGSTQCCEALLERGAKIDCTDKHLQTPLHIAASRGHAEVVQLLLERGASSSAKDSRGNTPLHLSVQFSSVPVAKVLLEASRAEVNSRDEKNRTPMHWAARIGSCEFLELLRSHGAELRVEDSLGRSPLLYAVRYHHREAATWLVQAGASLSNQERSQLRPRDLRYVQMWLKPSDISLENSGSLRTRRHHSRMQYSADKIRAPSETVTSWMEALRDTSTSPSPGTSPRHSAASSPITSPRTSGSPLPPVPQSGKGSKITVPTSARRGHTRSISTPGGFWQGLVRSHSSQYRTLLNYVLVVAVRANICVCMYVLPADELFVQ
jgi:ankyrin repeat protein